MKENGYVERRVVQSRGKEAEEAEEAKEEEEAEEDGQTRGVAEGRAGRIVSAGWLPAGARIEGTSRGEKETVGGMVDVRG